MGLLLHWLGYLSIIATSFALRACERWKLPPSTAAPEEILQWTKKDGELHNYIGAVIPEALAHTGATAFDEHLKGVQSVLRNWRADENLATAGLFHSIYGTEGFQGFKLPFTKRQQIRQLIGKKAERLVWIFCVVDRLTVDNLVDRYHEWLLQPAHGVAMVYQCTSRIELGRFPIVFQDESEWLDYIELTLADWLEQVEGAAEKANDLYEWGIGEAFSYRRHAYHKMAEILSTRRAPRLLVAKEMLQEVYDTESEVTRSLHQPITPPMNAASREAREAFASAVDNGDENECIETQAVLPEQSRTVLY